MVLSDRDMAALIRKGVIEFSPRLKPDQIGPGSVDLTLSKEFRVFKDGETCGKTLDLDKIDLEKVTEKVVSDKIVLSCGQLILGKTVERITLHDNICGHLEGRSRYARRGLAIHVTSSFIQPGSDNHQVLEIVNLAPYAMTLRAGTRCTQALFEYMDSPTSKPYRKVGKIARVQ
ncbi:dCTP deaminase, dUMP-forming [uncultured archaeon]|nr:dCTP deaminase, dUMP-forming [uncultured archaeon]